MASRRRGVGVAAVQRKQETQVALYLDYFPFYFRWPFIEYPVFKAKFNAKGEQMAGEQLQMFSKQLEEFTVR